ncbi:MAG: GNAT family N-acetyltransferase [Xanthomonadales bacterium]|nr:GNAT family N-acetyltransferase [Xanthomonadales bacterium]
MATTIRDAADSELDAILAINNDAVPNVTTLTPEELAAFHRDAGYFRVAISQGHLAGFLIALLPEHDYGSPNFQWFKGNYDQFVYIDRVVVASGFRGLGIGNVFYADVQSYAELRAPYLTCEVNLQPRNDVSLLFHGAQGFHEVGQQVDGEKRVSLLAKRLPSFEFIQERYGTAVSPVAS